MMGGCKIAEQTAQVETENAPVPGLVSPPQVESQSLPPQDQVQLIPPVVEAPIAEGAVIAETPVEVVANQSITIIGTIHYVELEGGFFGIVTQEGSKYFPQYLTSEFKVDGLPVRVEAMPGEANRRHPDVGGSHNHSEYRIDLN